MSEINFFSFSFSSGWQRFTTTIRTKFCWRSWHQSFAPSWFQFFLCLENIHHLLSWTGFLGTSNIPVQWSYLGRKPVRKKKCFQRSFLLQMMLWNYRLKNRWLTSHCALFKSLFVFRNGSALIQFTFFFSSSLYMMTTPNIPVVSERNKGREVYLVI